MRSGEEIGARRRVVARAAEGVLEGTVAYRDFEALSRPSDDDFDPILDELFHEIGHQPGRGGWFGVTDEEYAVWLRHVRGLIRAALDE